MFPSVLNTLIGNVQVTVKNDIYTINGFDGNNLIDEMRRAWSTSKLGKEMFTSVGKFSISFRKFFLIDVVYTFESMINNKKTRINKRALIKALTELYQIDFIKRIKSNDVKIPDRLDFKQLDKLKISLYPHQIEYLERYNEFTPKYQLNGHLANVHVGGGKTILGLSLITCAKKDVGICVVPMRAIHDAWITDIENIFKKPVKHWNSLSKEPIPTDADFYLIHYEALEKYMPFFLEHFSNKNVGVVIDECHNFNDIKSNRTNSLIKLCKSLNVKDVLWMSGSPFKATGIEMVPLLRTIDPLFDSKSEEAFIKIYGKSKTRALEILSNRINIVSYRIENEKTKNGEKIGDIKLNQYRADVKLKNGNEYTLPVIKVKMQEFIKERAKFYKENSKKYENDFHEAVAYYRDTLKNKVDIERLNQYLDDIEYIRREYDPAKDKQLVITINKFEKNIIGSTLPSELRKRFYKAKSVYKYVDLTIIGEALGTVLGKTRTQCNVDLANNLDNLFLVSKDDNTYSSRTSLVEIINRAHKKTILFTNFVEVVHTVSKNLINAGFRPLLVYGDTNKNLTAILDQFNHDDDANPLIATFQSLSTAVRLTTANTVVMLNTPFREHDYRQAYGRAFRLGQSDDVDVIDIFLDTGDVPNISTRSKEILETAAETVAIMLGVKKYDVHTSVGIEDYCENVLPNDIRLTNHQKDFFDNLTSNKGSKSILLTHW
jgi:SNF2 family DNA or RNA helicase